MKKGLGIILMLTIVVLLSSLAVFFVEDITTPIIETRQQLEIEEALKEVYPAIEGSGFTVTESTLDFSGSPITGAQEIYDGTVMQAIVYTVTFRGYSSDITYVVGVNSTGVITGYKTISQGDTAGFGAQIIDPANWTQFTDMLLESAGTGAFDGLAGASITTGAWKTAFSEVYAWHDANEVFPPLSDEDIEKIMVKSIVGDGYTITAIEPTSIKTLEDFDIESAYVADNGNEDEEIVVYFDTFFGFAGDNKVVVAINTKTSVVVELQVTSSDDSDNYGALILESDRWTQFTDQTTTQLFDGEFDGISGASITTSAWADSLQRISMFHQAEFDGNIVYTTDELMAIYQGQLSVVGEEIVDVTEQKVSNATITNVYDTKNDLGDILGTVYYVTTLGEYRDGPTFIQFLVGVNTDSEFTGIRILSTTDETLAESDLVITNPTVFDGTGYFGEELEGVSIDGAFALDSIDGFEGTIAIVQSALEEVARYHDEDYPLRDDYMAAQADLEAAYPSATVFNSLYQNYDFVNGILNVYEAKDGSDTLLGYVYVGKYAGREGDVTYAVGVDTLGVTQQMYIIDDSETWANAYPYDGSSGDDFATSPWLENFEGISITDYIADPVDGVADVSTTTGGLNSHFGLIESVLKIFNFHDDNSTGGTL